MLIQNAVKGAQGKFKLIDGTLIVKWNDTHPTPCFKMQLSELIAILIKRI